MFATDESAKQIKDALASLQWTDVRERQALEESDRAARLALAQLGITVGPMLPDPSAEQLVLGDTMGG